MLVNGLHNRQLLLMAWQLSHCAESKLCLATFVGNPALAQQTTVGAAP
jgi:hypothetical protein